MKIVTQATMDEHGSMTTKYRLTHDHTFESSDVQSLNNRTFLELHEPVKFGFSMSRIIHRILLYRWHYPSKQIFISKFDWKSAYRRIHTDYDTAVESCTMICNWMVINLRLTFGGRPCPSEFCVVSDVTADLATDIANHGNFRPGIFQVENKHLIGKKSSSNQTKEPALELSPNFFGAQHEHVANECFIDDDIAMAVDIGNAVEAMVEASMLAIQAVSRPLCNSEETPRKDTLSLTKLKAEDTSSTVQKVLG